MNRGKWGRLDIPQRDWICIEVVDHHLPLVTCEMCESQTIRYGHIMRHENYYETLECGCICAGTMEGDLEAAHHRELKIKRRSPPPKAPEADSWIRAADKLLAKRAFLSDKEITFVRDMRFRFVSKPSYVPSDRQTSWFVDLYRRLVDESGHTGVPA